SPMARRTRVPSYPARISSRRSTAGLRSQIGLDYRRILDDLLRRSLRDLRAFLHHDDVLRHRQDRSHHMLDDERSESQFPLQAREQSDRVAEFVRRESGEDLIEEEDPRAGREDPSEFEALPLLNRQAGRGDVLLARQANEAEDPSRRLHRLRQVPRLVASIERGHGNVLPAGHREEGPGDLVGLRDPGRDDPMGRQAVDPTAVQGDFSLRWFRDAGDQVQEGRLPGSIRSDQAEDVPLLQRQGDAADRAHAAEGLVDVRDREGSLHSIRPRSSGTYFRRVPTIPSGRKRAITTTRTPMMTNSKPISTVRKYWEDKYTATAPKRGPRSVPMPPITIIASMINEKVRENASFGKIPEPCQ